MKTVFPFEGHSSLSSGCCASRNLVTAALALLSAAALVGHSLRAEEPHQRFTPKRGPSLRGITFDPFKQQSEDSPGTLTVMAKAGLGQSFPVKGEFQPKAFDVDVIDGDDDHLVVEIRSPEGGQRRLDLRRGVASPQEVNGRSYSFLYVNVTWDLPKNPEADQATIKVVSYPRKGEVVFPMNTAMADSHDGMLLYSMKFNGGPIKSPGQLDAFFDVWKRAFPKDNFVMTTAAEDVFLPAFEIRNVRLAELARSIAFLSEGALAVEVVEDSPANLWRLGRAATDPKAAGLKMRAVAVPNIFALDGRLKQVQVDARELEEEREKTTVVATRSRFVSSSYHQTQLEPLREQKVIVLIGDEDGVSGMESFIKACEQTAAQDALAIGQERETKRQEEISKHILEEQRRREEDEAKRRKEEEARNSKNLEETKKKPEHPDFSK